MRILKNENLRPWHSLAGSAIARELVILEDPIESTIVEPGDVILGGGSNTFFCGAIKQRIVHPTWRGIRTVDETESYVQLRVGAGESWNYFVRFTARKGYYGLENLAAIPGQVGAAPVQNIGAYGVECGKCIESVECYDSLKHEMRLFSNEECCFSYRDSIFKHEPVGRFFITYVNFKVAKKGSLDLSYAPLNTFINKLKTPKDVFEAVTDIRWSKLPKPEETPNAGSFFHNPIVEPSILFDIKKEYPNLPHFPQANGYYKIPAAWLIEQAGLKGISLDKVGIYEKHALVLVNRGGDGKEIVDFSNYVEKIIENKFGIRLVREPNLIGE